MTFIPPKPSVSKILASGTTSGPVSEGPGTGKEWDVEQIILTNESGGSISQRVLINDGADRAIAVVDIADDATWILGPIYLNDGELFKLSSTTGVQYVLTGKELG